jgi:hypothetical protein
MVHFIFYSFMLDSDVCLKFCKFYRSNLVKKLLLFLIYRTKKDVNFFPCCSVNVKSRIGDFHLNQGLKKGGACHFFWLVDTN